jgi:phage repressor protein C with HTH and peptisase S24 domain
MVATVWERITPALKERGWWIAELARELKVSYQAVKKVAEGGAFGAVNTAKVANLLGLRSEYVATGEGPERQEPGLAHLAPAGLLGAPPPDSHQVRNVRQVWVVGSTQGGIPERVWGDGDHPVGSTDAFAEEATIDAHAFACRVVGDSMAPRYMPGEYALVEPGTVPELEDDVLVRLNTGETMLKRLLGRRGGVRLGSYNSPEVHTFQEEDITWMYYVVHPIPARRIKHRT